LEAPAHLHPSIALATSIVQRFKLLPRLSNREHPLQVSGDIVNTSPSGTKPR